MLLDVTFIKRSKKTYGLFINLVKVWFHLELNQ